MGTGNHDKLVVRLAQILIKFNRGETLDPVDLATEFDVNIRTIQRDLNERFAYLPVNKIDGKYSLEQSFLGKLSTRDIERFAQLAGIHGLFPTLSDGFLREIFDSQAEKFFLVKGHNYENLDGKESDFRILEEAIIKRTKISFRYHKQNELKSYRDIAPYRLINNKGVWYLAGLDGEKLKTFSFKLLEAPISSEETFETNADILELLDTDDSVWIGIEKQEVILKISSTIAEYFKRRKLIANQVIEIQLENGDIIVSTKIAHPNQIIPIVRYWIPHIRVISPEGMQIELETDLNRYLATKSNFSHQSEALK